jgi:hypothetical protein
MADRAAWEETICRQRQLAIAADAELRRCHPCQHYPPLRSAEPEPEPVPGDQCDESALSAEEDIGRTGDLMDR